jgi:hypothetical protein
MTFTCYQCGWRKHDGARIHAWLDHRVVDICKECYDELYPNNAWERCHECSEKFDPWLASLKPILIGRQLLGLHVCNQCFIENYVECRGCHRYVTLEDGQERNFKIYCEGCAESIDDGEMEMECEICGRSFIPKFDVEREEHLCSTCIDNVTEDHDEENDKITFKKNDENDRIVNDPESEA